MLEEFLASILTSVRIKVGSITSLFKAANTSIQTYSSDSEDQVSNVAGNPP